MISLRLPLIAAALILAATPTRAFAQVDFSQIQDVARAKAEEGLALFGENRWEEAYERFRLAEELFHAPTLVLHMGHCQRELGHLMAARALYRKVAEEQLAEGAPEAFRTAQAGAKAHVKALEARIPRISIAIAGEHAQKPRVLLDGGPVVALHPVDIEIDPGKHQLHASTKGTEPIDLEIDVKEGVRQRIDLELRQLAPPPPARPPEPGSLLPGAIALGAGLAGLVAGAITGGVVMAQVADIKEQCDGTRCPDTLSADADGARPIATVSNVSFVIGGAGVAAGVVLLLVRPGGGEPGRGAIQAAFGPGSIALRGAF